MLGTAAAAPYQSSGNILIFPTGLIILSFDYGSKKSNQTIKKSIILRLYQTISSETNITFNYLHKPQQLQQPLTPQPNIFTNFHIIHNHPSTCSQTTPTLNSTNLHTKHYLLPSNKTKGDNSTCFPSKTSTQARLSQ